jgi:SAM-dependent methyltransferase
MFREQLLPYIDKTRPVLEIGPLDDPTCLKPEYDVYYADARSTQEVKARYSHSAHVDQEGIVDIDYVIKDTYKDSVGGNKFGTVFSSHVLEHVGDIIEHFAQIAEILDDGNRYVLVIPDKRFRNDHFREATPFRDVIDVHINKDWRRFALDIKMNKVPCNHYLEYASQEVLFSPKDFYAVEDAYPPDPEKTVHDFDHYLVFTYVSFLKIVRDLLICNLLAFSLEYSYCPRIPSEFYVVLQSNKEMLRDGLLRKREITKLQGIINQHEESPPTYDWKELNDFVAGCEEVYFFGRPNLVDFFIRNMPTEERRIVKGLCISDGYELPEYHLPAYHISALVQSSTDKRNIGFALCLMDRNAKRVADDLRRLGQEKVFRIG